MLFGYHSLVADVRYKAGEELLDRLATAIDRDRQMVTGERMFWTGSDENALVDAAQAAVVEIQTRGAERMVPILGKGQFGEISVG